MFIVNNNNKLSAKKSSFHPVCLAAKRVRKMLVFSDLAAPGTEALAAEWYHHRCHQSLVGEHGLILEQGQAHSAWSSGNEEALRRLGAISVTLKRQVSHPHKPKDLERR